MCLFSVHLLRMASHSDLLYLTFPLSMIINIIVTTILLFAFEEPYKCTYLYIVYTLFVVLPYYFVERYCYQFTRTSWNDNRPKHNEKSHTPEPLTHAHTHSKMSKNIRICQPEKNIVHWTHCQMVQWKNNEAWGTIELAMECQMYATVYVNASVRVWDRREFRSRG